MADYNSFMRKEQDDGMRNLVRDFEEQVGRTVVGTHLAL